jgi:hypothetical protein
VDICPAQETEADLLSALIMQSKAHWGYSIEALESWRPELSITPASIREKPVFVAMVEGEVAAPIAGQPDRVRPQLAFQSAGREGTQE